MSFEADLLDTLPIIGEAKARGDLLKVLSRLRETRQWSNKGWPKREILDEVDDSFIHHREHAEKMMHGDPAAGYRAAKGIKSVKMNATVETCTVSIDGSREWDRKPHSYQTRIKFNNYKLIRTAEGMSWSDKARLLLEDNVQVHCTCDAYKYFYQWAATKRGFALESQKIPARIRNPKKHGTVCKHLEHALKYLGGNYQVIASAMKRHHQFLEEAMNVDHPLSESLITGNLHEEVSTFGLSDVISGLMAECAKKGMSKTHGALRAALTQAQLEGAGPAGAPKVTEPDTRFMPVVQDAAK